MRRPLRLSLKHFDISASVQKRQTALTLEVAGIRCVVVSPSPVSEVVDNNSNEDDSYLAEKRQVWRQPSQRTRTLLVRGCIIVGDADLLFISLKTHSD